MATVVVDIAKAVGEEVAHMMQQAPALDIDSTEKESVIEKETTHRPRKKQLQSGKLRSADTIIVHKVTWPHELVYTVSGQPAVYDEISIPLFVSSYLAVVEAKGPPAWLLMAQHLQEVMGDRDLYGSLGASEGFPNHLAPAIGAWPHNLGR